MELVVEDSAGAAEGSEASGKVLTTSATVLLDASGSAVPSGEAVTAAGFGELLLAGFASAMVDSDAAAMAAVTLGRSAGRSITESRTLPIAAPTMSIDTTVVRIHAKVRVVRRAMPT